MNTTDAFLAAPGRTDRYRARHRFKTTSFSVLLVMVLCGCLGKVGSEAAMTSASTETSTHAAPGQPAVTEKAASGTSAQIANTREDHMPHNVHDFSARRLNGQEESLGAYQGRVLLIVNTASKCGLTPQYEGLQQLYDDYAKDGLTVLGFPCNQFANQEPGTEEEIATFCSVNYGVTFPMFAPIDVNGRHAHPLYQYLKSEMPGLLGVEAIKWNFTKFLVDAQGVPVRRYGPRTPPDAIREDIETLLQAR